MNTITSAADLVRAIADLSYPHHPTKPSVITMGKTPDEIRAYADKLEAYERDLAEYKTGIRAYNEAKGKLEEQYMDHLRANSSLNPATFSIVYANAYDRGHSDGYSEVESIFHDMEDLAERIIAANKETK